jgi:hypothetical protein
MRQTPLIIVNNIYVAVIIDFLLDSNVNEKTLLDVPHKRGIYKG